MLAHGPCTQIPGTNEGIVNLRVLSPWEYEPDDDKET